MQRVLVSGVVNMETTLGVESFPLEYEPVRYPSWGIQSAVSGVGYNITKALITLGSSVRLLSFIGNDQIANIIGQALDVDGIQTDFVLPQLEQTPQSVVIYNNKGRRQIHTDLKDVNERVYPEELFQQAVKGCSLAILCNVGFSRSLIDLTREEGIQIATDLHTISEIDDPYNQDFMKAADVLFMSGEELSDTPEEWAKKLQGKYGTSIIVIGLGDQGVLLAVYDDNYIERIPAPKIRTVVNTIGAGDALFSSFNHFYCKTGDPYQSIQKAIVFASYKIGEAGAAQGLLTEIELEETFAKSKSEES